MMNIQLKSLMLGAALMVGAAGCASDNGSGDGGVSSDAGFNSDTASGPSYLPVSGKYKVTDYSAGSDACMINPGVLKGDADPAHWITVTVSASGSISIGNPKGTPSMASLGQGTLTGDVSTVTRTNHYAVGGGTPCEYDDQVTSIVTLDDPTNKSFGLGVTEKQTNRSMCIDPPGVPASCTSTWSWRLSFGQ
jgi:hypothetical protein